MRIISGFFKGKKILEPKDIKTRPLKDLTKESIFNRAWDKGHSSGYREVYYCYIDNIEFVKEILD